MVTSSSSCMSMFVSFSLAETTLLRGAEAFELSESPPPPLPPPPPPLPPPPLLVEGAALAGSTSEGVEKKSERLTEGRGILSRSPLLLTASAGLGANICCISKLAASSASAEVKHFLQGGVRQGESQSKAINSCGRV